MNQLMHENIFQAFSWLFRQLQALPDSALLDIAAAPFGFHFSDAPVTGLLTHDRLPFL
jgi:hypothetical protein